MQELLLHSTIGVTLDTNTHAVTTETPSAQVAVFALLFPQEESGMIRDGRGSDSKLCLFVPT
jgi:hypothetical protein